MGINGAILNRIAGVFGYKVVTISRQTAGVRAVWNQWSRLSIPVGPTNLR